MRQTGRLALGLVFGVILAAHGSAVARPDPCPGVLFPNGEGICPADSGAAVAACCPCGDPRFRNHGRYVSCVAHATNALRDADCLDDEARRSDRGPGTRVHLVAAAHPAEEQAESLRRATASGA